MKSLTTIRVACLLTALITAAISTASTSAAASNTSAHQAKKWNFVFIMADDQGWGDLACFGGEKIKTPHIDQMAQGGMKFTSFYTQPVCGQTRTALHTGCYPLRVAEFGNIKTYSPYIHIKEILLAKKLQEVGYKTGWIGKMDTTRRTGGYKPALNPTLRGYDFFYGVIGANDNGRVRLLHRNQERLAGVVPHLDNLIQDYTKEALGFIDRNKDEPFMLYVAHTMPHVRIARSAAFVGVSERGIYGDVIEEMDWSTGQIVKKIKDLGLDQNTIVIYTSDNGAFRGVKLPDESGSTGPLRGSKGTTWEGGVRAPCVMWGPGLIPAGTSTNEVASIMDIFPTFISLAGGQLPQDRTIDGQDLTDLMTGKPGAKSPHTYLGIYHENDLEAVRSGPWKLVLPYGKLSERKWLTRSRSGSRGKFAKGTFDGLGHIALFKVTEDLGETTNLADQHPEVVARLKGYADLIVKEIGNYQQIGQGVRFFDEGPKWPNLAQWRPPGTPAPGTPGITPAP